MMKKSRDKRKLNYHESLSSYSLSLSSNDNSNNDLSSSDDSSAVSSVDESESSYASSPRSKEEGQINLPKPPPPTRKKKQSRKHDNRELRIQKKHLALERTRDRVNNKSKNCKSSKSNVPIKRNCDKKNKSILRHRGRRTNSSSSPSSSSHSSSTYSRLDEPSSNIESQRKNEKYSNDSQSFYDSNSSCEESFLGPSRSNSSYDDDDIHSSSTSSSDEFTEYSSNRTRMTRKRKERKGKKLLEGTMRSVSTRASILAQNMKRPDRVFLIMATGIFIVCGLAAYVYFFGIMEWTTMDNNNTQTTVDIVEEMPSSFPTMDPSRAPHNIRSNDGGSTPKPTTVVSVSPPRQPSSLFPSINPIIIPTKKSSLNPTKVPTQMPSDAISNNPTVSQIPSSNPSVKLCSCTPLVYRWKMNFSTVGCPHRVSNQKGIVGTMFCRWFHDRDQERPHMDLKPNVITKLTMRELNPAKEVINEYTHDGILHDGDEFQYESVTKAGQVTGYLTGRIIAINDPGEFGLDFRLRFSNICEEEPFQIGDTIGYLEFSEKPKPLPHLCFFTYEGPSQSPTYSSIPSVSLSLVPASLQSQNPTTFPSETTSMIPSSKPTLTPSASPSSLLLSGQSSVKPSHASTNRPTSIPSPMSSTVPSDDTSNNPSTITSSSPSMPYGWETLAPTIHGPSSSEYFGGAVAIAGNGNCIAVGNQLDDQVIVYDLVNGQWRRRGDIIAGPPYSAFGRTLSMSNDGNIVAIGANEYVDWKGMVEVWVWNGSFWVQYGSRLYGENADDSFGVSLDMSSDATHLIIGSEHSNDWRGSVRVYKYDDKEWVQRGETMFGDPDDSFGGFEGSVSITDDGNWIAAGASRDRVKCFSWDGSKWNLMGSTIHGTKSSNFGVSVALTSPKIGEFVLAVGAPREENRGAIRVFDWDGSSNWNERQDFITVEELKEVGLKMIMSPDAKTILSTSNLAVLAFDWNGSYWIQRGAQVLKVGGDPLGRSDRSYMLIDLSHDANNVVIGIPDDDDGYFYGDNNGQVRSFQWRRKG